MKASPRFLRIGKFNIAKINPGSKSLEDLTDQDGNTSINFPLRYFPSDDFDAQEFPNSEENRIYSKLLKSCWSFEPFSDNGSNNNGVEISADIINKLDEFQGVAPLHYAAMTGNLEMVKFLVDNRADPHIWDGKKQVTPLVCAAAFGRFEVVKYLVQQNCAGNAGLPGLSGPSALLWAVKGGHPRVVRYLLDSNVSQNSTVPYSETPIHAAVISGSPEILEMLIDRQGSIVMGNLQMGPEKNTALHLAASGKFPNSLEVCEILLEKGKVDGNAVNWEQKTPLHLAAASGIEDVVELLILHGAEVDAVDCQERTPLFDAVDDDNGDCLEVLIQQDMCNVNHQDKQGYTALHYAAVLGATKAAEILLLNQADFSIKSIYGDSALSLLRRRIPVLNSLLQKTFDQAVTLTSEYPAADSKQECKVVVDFTCILPTSSSPSLSTTAGIEINDKSSSRKLRKGLPIYHRAPNSKDDPEKPFQNSSTRKETGKIKCLIDENLTSLLLHPVVHSFLELKWRQARPIFLPTIFFKVLLGILFSVYVQLPYVIRKKLLQEEASPFDNGTIDYDQPLPGEMAPPFYEGMYIAVVALATIKGLIEFIQVVRAPKAQLKTVHPWISLAVLLIMIFYMSPDAWITSSCPCRRSMAALGIVLTWTDIWFDMGRLPEIGLSIRVFLQVFKNFGKFILPHVCLLAGFTFAFTLIFHQNGEFNSIAVAVTKIVRIMAGDITIVSEGVKVLEPEDSLNEILAHLLVVYIYTAYVLIVAIVLMNLLVGLAVNDIQGIFADAAVDKLVKQTILLNTLETNCNRKWMRNRLTRKLFSKYIYLFPVSSSKKTLTFKPYDPSDCNLSDNQKKALLEIGNANIVKDKANRSLKQTPSSVNEDHRELMEKINVLVTSYLAKRSKRSTR